MRVWIERSNTLNKLLEEKRKKRYREFDNLTVDYNVDKDETIYHDILAEIGGGADF